MMPVETITMRATLSDGTKLEHSKPVYWCEERKALRHTRLYRGRGQQAKAPLVLP